MVRYVSIGVPLVRWSERSHVTKAGETKVVNMLSNRSKVSRFPQIGLNAHAHQDLPTSGRCDNGLRPFVLLTGVRRQGSAEPVLRVVRVERVAVTVVVHDVVVPVDGGRGQLSARRGVGHHHVSVVRVGRRR